MDGPTREATAAFLDAWRSGRIVRLIPARAGSLEMGGATYSADEIAQQALIRHNRGPSPTWSRENAIAFAADVFRRVREAGGVWPPSPAVAPPADDPEDTPADAKAPGVVRFWPRST